MTFAPHIDRVSILVVDDHQENVLALQAMLSRYDYEVVGANSGAEALKRILKQEFAVILLDVLMPVMDGFETARLIRQREASRSVPIIFLTANAAEVGLVYQGYAVGAVDYMIKPLDPDIVRAKVAVFVELFRKTQQVRAQEERLREAERRRSEHALRRSEALYEATFDEAAVGIGHTAFDGRWLRMNRKLRDVLGYGESYALRVRLQDVTHPDDVPATVAALRQMAAGEFDSFRREQRCLTSGGSVVWVNLMLSVLRGADGLAGQFIVVVEDITERKLAADRQRVLSAVSERLLHSLDDRGTLDAVAAALVPALADWCLLDVRSDRDGESEFVAAHADPAKVPLVRAIGERTARDPASGLADAIGGGSCATIAHAEEAPARAFAGPGRLVHLGGEPVVDRRDPLHGVFSSCDAIDRNSSRSRIASCAWASRSRSSSSRRRSVRSRVTLVKPISWPEASWIGVITTLAQNLDPSLQTRQASTSKLPSLRATSSSRSGAPSAMSSGVKNLAKSLPMISSAAYPLIRSAPGFQVATRPSLSRTKIA